MGRRSPDTSYKAQSARRVTTIAVEPHSLTQRTTPIIRVPHTTRRLNRPYAQASAGSTWGEVESDESEALLNGHTAAYERPSDRKRPRTPGGCRTPDPDSPRGPGRGLKHCRLATSSGCLRPAGVTGGQLSGWRAPARSGGGSRTNRPPATHPAFRHCPPARTAESGEHAGTPEVGDGLFPTGRGGVLRTSGGAGKQVPAGVRSLSRIAQPWRT